LPKMKKMKLLQLHFSATAAVVDVGDEREGCLTTFWGKWVYIWML